MHRHQYFSINVCRSLHCFFGQHVYGMPGNVILAAFQQGNIKLVKLFADSCKMAAIATIGANKNRMRRCFQYE